MKLKDTKIEITRLTKTLFHFAYDYQGIAEHIKGLTEFTHKGIVYCIIKIKEDFSVSGSPSFIVRVRRKK